MSRRIHRVLVFTALTIVAAAGLWAVAGRTVADGTAAAARRSDVATVAQRLETDFVPVRLRAPTPCAASTEPRRNIHDTALQGLQSGHASERHRSAHLYALLRVYRI